MIQKAVEHLSKPRWGWRSLLAAVPACVLVALMALNAVASWFYSFGYFIAISTCSEQVLNDSLCWQCAHFFTLAVPFY